jgi:hypothetical protein
MSIVGYLVHLVDDEVTAKDIFYQQWILYPTWESALAAASKITSTLTADGDYVLCTLRGSSKSICHTMGHVIAYRLDSKDVIICPVTSSV